jgi:predicted Zn-dependent peptidase
VGQVAKPIFSIGIKDVHVPTDAAACLKRDAGMAILNEMLFSEAGELYNRLYDEGFISPDLSSDYVLARDFGFWQIAGEAEDPAAVLREIDAFVEEKKKSGLSAEDFERCRRIEYAEYIKSFDSTEEIANTLLSFVFAGAELFSYSDVILQIDLPFVEGLMREIFDSACTTLSVVYPDDVEERS